MNGKRKNRKMQLVGTGLVVILLLGGCGGKGDIKNSQGSFAASKKETNQTLETEPIVSSTAKQEETTETDDSKGKDSIQQKTDDSKGQDSIQQKTELLDVRREEDYSANAWDDNGDYIFSGKFDRISVETEGYTELKAALERINESNEKELMKAKDDSLQYRKENGISSEVLFTTDYTTAIQRADAKILSMITTEYSYFGGAHPSTVSVSCNLNPENGQELQLWDIAEDYEALKEYVLLELQDINGSGDTKDGYYTDYADTVKAIFNPTDASCGNPVFSIDTYGIMLRFDEYVIGPYARGNTVLTIGFDEIPGVIKEEYIWKEDGFARPMSVYDSITLDVDGDEIKETISISQYNAGDLYGYSYSYKVFCDNTYIAQESEGNITAVYLVGLKNGTCYLYVETGGANDYRCLDIIDLSSGTPVLKGNAEASFYGRFMQNPERFALAQRIYVLGTYSGSREYFTGEDGMPVSYTDRYEVEWSEDWGIELKTIVDLEAKVYDTPDDREHFRNITLPAGTSCHVSATDDVSWVELTLKDGSTCVLEYEKPDWEIIIQGKSEYDCFEMLPYAG